MDVGIRELKAHLSEYLDRAAQGEVIRVTDRGQLKAVLSPPPTPPRFDVGVRDGWITPGDRTPVAKVIPQRADRTVGDVLAEDRGD